jgi:hypothetical protein
VPNHLLRVPPATTLLDRLIQAPDLVRRVRELPAQTFSALVRQVGVEDAGEIVALATIDQLVAAFDEDLFINERPGEREVFDSRRFAIWLEVLLEAGDEVAAKRVAELSEDFVIGALSSLVLVLDNDALNARMSEGDQAAISADKALESTLCEEIDGYLLISRQYDSWDASLALILALDRDHRALLERILDRSAAIASEYVEDLESLVTVLSAADSLAEDVEAQREERRAMLGYVEPRAAKSYLELAKRPTHTNLASEQRDPITRAHFRELKPRPGTGAHRLTGAVARLGQIAPADAPHPMLGHAAGQPDSRREPQGELIEAMRLLSVRYPERFNERMQELAYLANVLVAGGTVHGRRFRASEAAEAAIATVALGAELLAYELRVEKDTAARATTDELCEVITLYAADLLFRKASSTLSARDARIAAAGYLNSRDELGSTIAQLNKKPASRSRKTGRK